MSIPRLCLIGSLCDTCPLAPPLFRLELEIITLTEQIHDAYNGASEHADKLDTEMADTTAKLGGFLLGIEQDAETALAAVTEEECDHTYQCPRSTIIAQAFEPIIRYIAEQ